MALWPNATKKSFKKFHSDYDHVDSLILKQQKAV